MTFEGEPPIELEVSEEFIDELKHRNAFFCEASALESIVP